MVSVYDFEQVLTDTKTAINNVSADALSMDSVVTHTIEVCIHNESPRALGKALGRYPCHDIVERLIINANVDPP